MKHLLILFFILSFFYSTNNSQACTTAIVSGKFTVDGRPLLFKHRDSGTLQNKIMYFQDGKYDYMGLVNSPDLKGDEVWAGTNSAGFSIMNSASYNLNLQDTTSLKDREGFVMKQALQSCATLKDFENLLRNLPKPMGLNANFGVIDAKGGAAYYETSNYNFTKFDANDPSYAPFGYIIRTNFSFTGAREKEYGLIRFQNAENLFQMAANTKTISHLFILNKVSRSLKHALTGSDLSKNLPDHYNSNRLVNFTDFIPRYDSAASVVIQGVLKNENPRLTTMWTVLGFPLSSVALPTWIAGGSQMPKILMADTSGNAPLCDKALTLKKKIFPLRKGSYRNYIDQAVLLNKDEDGILQKTLPFEKLILAKTAEKLTDWRKNKVSVSKIHIFYNWLNKTVEDFYRDKFGM